MKRTLLLGASLTVLTTPFALAQNIADNETGDEIVVVAQKREQNIKDVPLSITAFGQQDLDDVGIQQFDDLADFVPGLEVQEQSANNPGFVIRGITSDSGDATIEPRVAVFQDGVPISRSRGSFVELFDTNVEVVRGPQPTLFGRSALIGAVSINSVRPKLGEAEGYVRLGTGNLDFLFTEGALNIPLGDDAALRVAGRYKQRDGYTENLIGDDLNGFELGAFRGSLRVEPSERLSLDLIYNYQNDSNPGTSFKSGTFLPVSDTGEIGVLNPSEPAALNAFGGIEGGRDLGLEREVHSLTLLADFEINDTFTISSVTNYREFDSSEVFDPDGFNLPLFAFAENAVGDQFFQELRLGFEGASGFSGFVGASFFTEDGSQNVPLFYDETVAQALLGGFLFTSSVPTADGLIPPPLAALPSVLLNPATGAPVLLNPADPTSVVPLGTFSEEFTNFGENDAVDIFADVSYQLTDRLEFTAGVRYTRDDKTSGYAADSDGVSTLTGAGVFVGANVFNNNQRVEVSDTFDGFTYRFALAYALTDDINLFANYGRGRRPEVLAYAANVAQPNILAENFTTVDAETTDAFELGARGSTLDGRLNFDVTGYYYDYTNFQTTVLNDVGTPVPVNGGNASGFGFEFQNDFRVTEWAMLFANYAYNGVEFDDEDGDGNRQVRAGNRFRLSPEHAFTVGGVLSAETPVGSVRLTPLYSYKSKTFFDDDNDTTDAIQDEFQDGYGVVDLRFVMEPNFMEGLAIELFVENLANKEFIIDAGNTGDAFGIPTFIAGPPRLYGGYVRLAF